MPDGNLGQPLAGVKMQAPLPALVARRREHLLVSGVVVSSLVFVWLHRFLPLQDYPDWLVQGKLFTDLIQGRLADPYTFIARPVPNAVSSVCIGLLTLGIDAESAGKLVLSGYVLAHVVSARNLLRFAGQPLPLGALAISLALLLSYPFFHGNLNYLLSLPLLYAGQARLLRHPGALQTRDAVWVAGLGLAIYFSHGAGYVAWLLFVLAYAWTHSSASTRLRLLLSLSPSLLATVSYAAARGVGSRPLIESASLSGVVALIGDRVWTLIRFMCPFQGFYPFVGAKLPWLFVVANVATVLVCLHAVVRWWPRVRSTTDPRQRTITRALTLYALTFVLAPQHIGGLVNPAERMLLPAFHLLLASMVPLASRTAARVPVRSLGAVLLLGAQAAYLHGYAGSVSERLAATHHSLKKYAPLFPALLHESHFDFEDQPRPSRPLGWLLLPMHYPLLRLSNYGDLETGRAVPIFDTGLFRTLAKPAIDRLRLLHELRTHRAIVLLGSAWGNAALVRNLPFPVTPLQAHDGSILVVAPTNARGKTLGTTQ